MFINSTGYFIPEKRISNDYFLEVNGLTSDWIYQRTGILSRSKATEEETMNVMCSKAVHHAIQGLPYDIREVDLIIFASYTPSDTVGTTAHVMQREFQIEKARVFYLSSACSSAINAMEIIGSFFNTGLATKALLISADRNSTYYNETDPKSGHLWGDAAAVFFFSKDRYSDKEAEVIDIETQGLGHVGYGPNGVSLNPKEGILMPKGKDVFMQACTYISQNTKEIVERNKLSLSDLTWFIGHQANMRILSYVVKELGIPEEKSLSNISELGNTGSVSALLVFAQNTGRFQKGDSVCLSVFGGGYSSGSCLIRC
ncbi:MAG: ketoacyl-ACP synthase III [Bacteroidales bacterium]|jgi:3-oxoacyl-[acyl-carrier-protein] synthase-3|nr:ketoacyl-ACP synthase III [Bacteroidales bacterium]